MGGGLILQDLTAIFWYPSMFLTVFSGEWLVVSSKSLTFENSPSHRPTDLIYIWEKNAACLLFRIPEHYATGFSETPTHVYQTTRRCIPEGYSLYAHPRENLEPPQYILYFDFTPLYWARRVYPESSIQIRYSRWF